MRILVDARPLCDITNGGVSRVSCALARAYVAAHPEDELICLTTGMRKMALPTELATAANVRHIHHTLPNKLWSLGTVLGMTALDRMLPKSVGEIDTVFLPNIGFSGRLTKPYVVLLHDLSFLIEPRWYTRKRHLWHKAVKAKECIKNAKRLLAVSETTKADAIRLLGIPAERIRVIPMGTTLSAGAQCIAPSGMQEDVIQCTPALHRYVLAMDANNPRKNATTAIAATRALRRYPEFADVELKLIGPWVSDAELTSFYQHASAFLYPSWYEGFGLPLHEAAAFGTPCIASTTGALPETAPSGTLFANPAKPQQWVEALKIVLTRSKKPVSDITSVSWTPAAEVLHQILRAAS